ncbi:carotenoid oxygenase family protein [Nesterenkonia sp. NBAIMH1]|uniref:carotenoid oxygenase family protein n=1 Tax=Nesterenkonia sp. NBAIMH1 TaxID=2600320 RepID=UPI001AF01CF6|nr:carotenoid oxygenase family protein [Nesterenkonia sp. NBAIMH1]
MNTASKTVTSLALVSALALSACAGENGEEAEEQNDSDQNAAAEDTGADEAEGAADADDDADAEGEDDMDPSEREQQEAGGAEPRVAVTYDGGAAVLDGVSLDVIDEFDADGFLRINEAGDGRHAFLTEGSSFRLLDAGTWGEPHGEHNHYYTTEPYLSDVTVDGDTPAHVVSHDGIGTLFFDGTGEYRSFDLAELDVEAESLETESYESEGEHHGVAVVLEDGSRFETLEDRSGARFLDADGEEMDRNENCPGVHGEAAGPEGVIAVGCEDGVLVWDGEQFEKHDTGEDYSRIGNLFPSEGSPIFLGDYRTDQDGEEPMTEVALVNTESGDISTVNVDSPYNFRNLQRGPDGEALVLTEDGQLHIIDPETGEHLEHIDVIDEWTEPEDWQEPRPAIRAHDDLVYVTDPDSQEIHLLDLTEGEVITTAEFDFEPNEIIVIDGRPVGGVSSDYDEDHEDDDHAHDDDDHDHDEDHDDDDHGHDDDGHDHDHEDDHDH